MDLNAQDARGRALMDGARAALGDRDVTRARALAHEAAALGAPALREELASLRVHIDDVEAADVPDVAFRGAKTKGDCMLAVSELARHVDSHPGTALTEKLRSRARDAVVACLAETVAARLGAGDFDGARRLIADDRVKVALGIFEWEEVSEPLARHITEVEALQGFKVFVTGSLGRITTDIKQGTISYDGIVSDMSLIAFKKSYPEAGKLPSGEALLDKYFPGRVSRLRPGAGQCATCVRDSSAIAHAEFVGGRLSEAFVQRRGGNGPAAPSLTQTWNGAFREAVRAALSARFATMSEVAGHPSSMLAHLTKRTAAGDGPALLVEWSVHEGSVLLSLKVWGSAHDGYAAMLERARASEERAQERARKLELARTCNHVRVGKRWSIQMGSFSGPVYLKVVAIHRDEGMTTVEIVNPGALKEELAEWSCSDIQ
ncbi:Hypothetical protein A7982_07994 [Minicystis rosea]|nr:Hypothetical protein A7982_07994 [Minicystis rosea]